MLIYISKNKPRIPIHLEYYESFHLCFHFFHSLKLFFSCLHILEQGQFYLALDLVDSPQALSAFLWFM